MSKRRAITGYSNLSIFLIALLALAGSGVCVWVLVDREPIQTANSQLVRPDTQSSGQSANVDRAVSSKTSADAPVSRGASGFGAADDRMADGDSATTKRSTGEEELGVPSSSRAKEAIAPAIGGDVLPRTSSAPAPTDDVKSVIAAESVGGSVAGVATIMPSPRGHVDLGDGIIRIKPHSGPTTSTSQENPIGKKPLTRADEPAADVDEPIVGDLLPVAPDEGPGESPPAIPTRAPTGSLAVDFVIGNSHPDPRRRMIGWNILGKGWVGFIERFVRPYTDAGVARIVLHNPFGTLPDENMMMDQFLFARDIAGLRRVTNGFPEAWRPIVEEGVEVIAYLGCPMTSKEARRIDEEDGRDAGLAYCLSALQPVLDAKMTIALDAAVLASADSLTYALADELKRRGVKVYVEAWPSKDSVHWHGFPVMILNDSYYKSNPAITNDTSWAATREQVGGEILRLVFEDKPSAFQGTYTEFHIDRAKQVVRDGDTPVFSGANDGLSQRIGENNFLSSSPAYD